MLGTANWCDAIKGTGNAMKGTVEFIRKTNDTNGMNSRKVEKDISVAEALRGGGLGRVGEETKAIG